jgi:hypothetical protein
MTDTPLKQVSMPKRFTLIAAIFLGAIAASQVARAFYGVDMQVNGMHVPMAMSWIVAVLFGLVAVAAFREADA